MQYDEADVSMETAIFVFSSLPRVKCGSNPMFYLNRFFSRFTVCPPCPISSNATPSSISTEHSPTWKLRSSPRVRPSPFSQSVRSLPAETLPNSSIRFVEQGKNAAKFRRRMQNVVQVVNKVRRLATRTRAVDFAKSRSGIDWRVVSFPARSRVAEDNISVIQPHEERCLTWFWEARKTFSHTNSKILANSG